MKFRTFSFLFIFALCVFVFLICKPETKGVEEVKMQQTPKEIMALMIPSKDVIVEEKSRQNLADRVIVLVNTLIDHFNARDFGLMGELLESHGAILEGSQRKYTKVFMGKNISELFSTVKDEKINKLQDERVYLRIEIRNIVIDKIDEYREVRDEGTPEEKQADMVARVIFKYHILGPKEGGIIDNQTGGATFEILHRKVCSWDE